MRWLLALMLLASAVTCVAEAQRMATPAPRPTPALARSPSSPVRQALLLHLLQPE